MNGSKPLDVWIGDKRFGGWWIVEAGDLKVFSAYGSRKVKIGRRKPERYAAELLEEIVREWLTT